MAAIPARLDEHEDHVSLAQSRAARRPCVPVGTACATAVVALIGSILALVLGTGLLLPRSSVVLTQSPVSPTGYALLGPVHAGEGEWVRKRRMPSAASDLQAVVVGDTVLVLGGLGHASPSAPAAPRTDVLAFSTVFERFNASAAPPLPTPLYRFAAAAVSTLPAAATAEPGVPAAVTTAFSATVVVAGGITTTGGTSTTATWTLSVRVDPSDATRDTVTKALALAVWRPGPALPVARSDLAMAAVKGGVVVVGGFDPQFNSLSDTLFLDVDAAAATAGSAWSAKSAMPTARGDVTAVADATGDHVMALGGWGGADNTFQAAVESWDADKDAWTTLADLPFARGDKAAALLHGHVVAVGGEVTSGLKAPCYFDPSSTCDVNQVPVHDVEALLFDFAASSTRVHTTLQSRWEARAPFPSARFRFAAASVGGVLYTFGGHAEGADSSPGVVVSSDVYAYFAVDRPDLWVHVPRAA